MQTLQPLQEPKLSDQKDQNADMMASLEQEKDVKQMTHQLLSELIRRQQREAALESSQK